MAVDEVARSLQISLGFTYEIIPNKLRARWAPRELIEAMSAIVLSSVNAYSTATTMKVKLLFERIFTQDETWLHQFEPESKRQSMEVKHSESLAKKKFKTQPSPGKSDTNLFGEYWNVT
ncbi:uncharacterized protein LOC115226899 [Octopus sinensis]|uniref:Uncharacterized protein LOC115226899 n=1 Tax=Octopus sinensis TaxID=2607531 RepID=A0A6P7TYA3_9MOLL|nr:uncharacterized protein LOC115226899 [Octopus sinensis]